MVSNDRTVAGLALAAALLVAVLAFGTWMPHHDGWVGVWGGAWGVMMAFMMLVPALLVAFLIIGVLKALGASPARDTDAQSILDERLARGDISVDEHRERSAALRR